MELKGTKINFLGDSITEGAGTSSHDKMFTMLIEREYGAICQNYGIGGTNDFGHGDAPIGTMSDRTPYTFYGALHCLYTALIEKYAGVPIVVLTPLHRITEDIPTGDNKPAPVGTLKEYVNIIREVAEYYSLPVLDLFKESGLQPKIPVIQQKYVPDGLHPNDAGNEILAHKIARFLEML